jgi:malonyl-CoA/methylmalonyl-CoA synthetase
MADVFFPPLRDGNEQIALREGASQYSYGELETRVQRLAGGLLVGREDLQEERIAFLIPASVDYVTVMLAVWRAGAIAVPLNVASATVELEHYLGSAGVRRLIVNPGEQNPALEDLCASLGIAQVTVASLLAQAPAALPAIAPTRRALMIFTSGTTSKPKGVISTHDNLRAQIETLIEAWAWSDRDVIPLFLPLHHVHGIINVLCCALWAGATVDLFPKLDVPTLTERVGAGQYTLFMAVPTIYVKLLRYLEGVDDGLRRQIADGFATMRLNVSGSAACPVKLFEQWRALTGQRFLERYGMTEIGMALSNPYRGERRAGYVGQPLPGVDLQLFDEAQEVIGEPSVPGEIRVRGRNVFLEYWDNEKATREAFVDGWFCTGDMAVVEDGYYRIMGRASVDIIKSGGYKLSALEIEGVLLNHPAIEEAAVLGIEDETWGEAVVAVVVLRPGATLDIQSLKAWCGDRMAAYKIPRALRTVDALPRNAMGKVTKPQLRASL